MVLTYDLLEDRRIDDVIVKTFFNSLLYKTNRFQVAVRLFSNRSQRTSKFGKNISDTHFDVLCDLLLNRRTAIWIYLLNVNVFAVVVVVVVDHMAFVNLLAPKSV